MRDDVQGLVRAAQLFQILSIYANTYRFFFICNDISTCRFMMTDMTDL